MRSRPRLLLIRTTFVIACGLLLSVRSAPAATPEEVQKAIEKAQKFLISQQKNGNWEEVPSPVANGTGGQADVKGRQWGGLTAISTYALLASGKNPQDKDLKPAVQFLQRGNIEGTYAMGLASQIYLFIPETKEARQVMKRNVAMLYFGMIRNGPHIGFYGYWTGGPNGSGSPVAPNNLNAKNIGTHQPGDWYDRSNSQYGVLGMWALEEAGGEVPADYWKIVDAAWRKAQQADGGWTYNDEREVAPSMTAAGVATLFITQDYLLPNRWDQCRGGMLDQNIEAGLRYMDHNIASVLASNNYYTFYGIERIGVASGRKYFGTFDWYQTGADYIVKNQRADGSWEGDHGVVPNTCFCLLFLSRGRAPVMMNKLQYSSAKAKNMTEIWNERPRDAANIAKWTGKEIESYLNWQVVNLKVPAEDLHDAPILYISGSQELDFNDEERAKLRAFVEQGGLILGNADCNSEAFSKSFRALGTKLFQRYEFQQLPGNDPIFTSEQYKASKWRVKPRVLGLSNGARYLMLLIPESDASRAWQTRSDRNKEDLYQLGANIFLYSTDQRARLRVKGDTYIVKADEKVIAKHQIKVARLAVGYNADPEPYGWTRLANLLHNKYQTDLDGYQTPIKPTDPKLKECQVAHLTGTGKLQLTDADRAALKDFLTGGGTLIVDATGGDSQFSDTAEAELNAILGPQAAKELRTPLPPNSPLYKDANIKQIAYRRFARPQIVGNAREPRLCAATVNKRLAVFFSREDLSAGLVGEPIDGIYGYEPQSAADLMTAMLFYAVGKVPTPSTQPAVGTQPAGAAGK